MVSPSTTPFSKFFALEIFVIGATWITAGTLNLLGIYAVQGYILSNNPPGRIAQSVATLLFGNAAYVGGAYTAYWGLALHYITALFFTVLYFLLYPQVPFFQKHTLAGGILYGLIVWVFMNFIVLPFSDAGLSGFTFPDAGWSLLLTVFLLGLPIALIMHLYFRRRKK
jgi:hypothetical protein